MKEIIEKIKNNKNVKYEVKDEKMIVYNVDNSNYLEVIEETYSSKTDSFIEYIVSFSTQHSHFDNIGEVLEYMNSIMGDQVLPIEFYYNNEKRFGGEITLEQFTSLSITLLADIFGYSEEYISKYDYEIHSWSGKNDIERQPIINLKENQMSKTHGLAIAKVSQFLRGDRMIEFKKPSEFPKGTLYKQLVDAYSFNDECIKVWKTPQKEYDEYFYNNLDIADKYCFITVLDGVPIISYKKEVINDENN